MSDALLVRIDAWIDAHREELIGDLIRLINVRSVSESSNDPENPFGQGCADALTLALEMGQEKGLYAEDYLGYVGRLSLSEGSADLGIWAHLDVVPEADHWIYEPYDAIYHEGYVIGRGAADNKGPLIAALYLLWLIKELEIPFRKNLALYLGTNEEAGMADLIFYNANGYQMPRISLVPDCAFPLCHAEKGIIEVKLSAMHAFSPSVLGLQGGLATNVVPDSAQIAIAYDESLLPKLDALPQEISYEIEEDAVLFTAHGITGHTAFPQGSQNAIGLLCEAILKAELLPPSDLDLLYFISRINEDVYGTALHIDCSDEISGRLTAVGSVLRLNGEHCAELTVNIRYPVKASSEKLIASINTACAQNRFRMELLKDSHPAFVPATTPFVLEIMEEYKAFTGDDSKPYSMAGGTYARRLPNAVGFGMGWQNLPQPPFLPAGHGGAHAPDEAVEIDGLLRAMKLYARVLLRLNAPDSAAKE
ncbi:MAG: Sapep family Mn(2+)-dependent dipeptidase [Christensenellaceae bacterium]|nr:Sapep family Mn(2+)-dependent dipeptidase [Christensenellaceae bacterium]